MNKLIQNQQFRDFGKFGLLLIWVSVIFFFSSLPGSDLPVYDYWELIIRKIAHVTEFAILTFLIFKVISAGQKSNFLIHLLTAMLLAFLVAVGDEAHQGLTLGRHPKMADIFIDLLGSVTMAWLMVMEKMYQMNHPKNNHWIKL